MGAKSESRGGESCDAVRALLDEVEQEGADVLGPERLGGFAEVPGEACDTVDVDADGAGREVAELHVLGHAEPERSHGVPPSGVETWRWENTS